MEFPRRSAVLEPLELAQILGDGVPVVEESFESGVRERVLEELFHDAERHGADVRAG